MAETGCDSPPMIATRLNLHSFQRQPDGAGAVKESACRPDTKEDKSASGSGAGAVDSLPGECRAVLARHETCMFSRMFRSSRASRVKLTRSLEL